MGGLANGVANSNTRSVEGEWMELPVKQGLKANWNLLWTWSKPRINLDLLLTWQKVNHLPGARALTRKDLLKTNLQRYQCLNQRLASELEVCICLRGSECIALK
jgi:hypothetical protein